MSILNYIVTSPFQFQMTYKHNENVAIFWSKFADETTFFFKFTKAIRKAKLYLRVARSCFLHNVMAQNNIERTGKRTPRNLLGGLLHMNPLPVSELALLTQKGPPASVLTRRIHAYYRLYYKQDYKIIARYIKELIFPSENQKSTHQIQV